MHEDAARAAIEANPDFLNVFERLEEIDSEHRDEMLQIFVTLVGTDKPMVVAHGADLRGLRRDLTPLLEALGYRCADLTGRKHSAKAFDPFQTRADGAKPALIFVNSKNDNNADNVEICEPSSPEQLLAFARRYIKDYSRLKEIPKAYALKALRSRPSAGGHWLVCSMFSMSCGML